MFGTGAILPYCITDSVVVCLHLTQHEASRVVNETVARFSMVTEGIKAYRGSSAPPPPAPGKEIFGAVVHSEP